MRRARWISAYVMTAGLGLGSAYLLTLGLLPSARSQTPPSAPSDGSLPPEFQDPNATQAQPVSPGGETEAPAVPPPPPTSAEAPAAEASAPEASATPQAPDTPAAGTAVGTEEYVYDPVGRRDPFRPYRTIRTVEPTRPARGQRPQEDESNLEPLQRFEIDQLTVLGILWDVKQPRALIRDGAGKIHTLVKNTKLGRNNGYVATIREGEIVVIESFDEEDGRTVKRTRILEFRRKL